MHLPTEKSNCHLQQRSSSLHETESITETTSGHHTDSGEDFMEPDTSITQLLYLRLRKELGRSQ